MAKVKFKFSETTKEQRRELLDQLRRETNPTESLAMLLGEMSRMENLYEMSTVEFYAKFVEGKLGDDRDFISWASDFQSYQQLLAENFGVVVALKKAA